MTVSLLSGAVVMKLKFTEKALEAKRRQALREGKDLLLWDTELRGFGAKASAHGRLSWLVQKWLGGRHGGSKRIVIGHCPPKDLDTARIEAGGIINQVQTNIDVLDRKKQQRAKLREQFNGITLEEAWAHYVSENGTSGRYWAELQTRFNNEVLPKLGRPKLAEVTKDEIRALIRAKQKEYPGAARTLFVGLSSVL